jgi:hypothetical protein
MFLKAQVHQRPKKKLIKFMNLEELLNGSKNSICHKSQNWLPRQFSTSNLPFVHFYFEFVFLIHEL